MFELRRDPILNSWVIIAPERSLRPNEFAATPVHRASRRCPFCFGNEDETPPAVATYPAEVEADPGAWQVRVVPNRYPAVAPLDSVAPAGPQMDLVSDRHRRNAVGVHEVVIESRDHRTSFAQLSDETAGLAFHAYRDRLRWVRQHTQLPYGQVFKNSGAAAGASIEHIHSQLLAIPYVPPHVAAELAVTQQNWRQTGQCTFCVLLEQELSEESRIVADSAGFVAFCPYASRFPYEVWLLPRRHDACFDRTPDADLLGVAVVIRAVITRLERVLDRPAYNWFVHTAPFDSTAQDHYHWHIEISPRVSAAAGFESGTGCFINPVPPEVAAQRLRESA